MAPTQTPRGGTAEVPVLLAAQGGEDAAMKPPAKRARRAASADGAKASNAKRAPGKTADAEAVEAEDQHAAGEEAAGGRASLYIVTKAVRNFLKGLPVPIHCGADFIPALNTMLQQQLNDAVSRAKANGRKTVRSSDL